eukprot:9503190-Pyramimonas_sp.AAC.3
MVCCGPGRPPYTAIAGYPYGVICITAQPHLRNSGMLDGIAEPSVKTHVGHVVGSLSQSPQKNTLGSLTCVSYCPGSSGMPTLRS